jgi:NADPH:quinone reductase-like Zn-dependent oxidoreductase
MAQSNMSGSKAMKAIVIDGEFGLDHLKSIDRPEPKTRRGEIVIRTSAVSLNYRDTDMVAGTYPFKFPLPLVPTSDGVGEVVAVGDGVTRAKVGDRVLGTFWQSWVGGDFDQTESVEVGGPDSFMQSLQAIRPGGQILCAAICRDVRRTPSSRRRKNSVPRIPSTTSRRSIVTSSSVHMIGYVGSKTGEINPLEILYRRVVVRGIPIGSRESFEHMNRAVALHRMRPVVDRVFPWMEARTALQYLREGKHFGKIVLKF